MVKFHWLSGIIIWHFKIWLIKDRICSTNSRHFRYRKDVINRGYSARLHTLLRSRNLRKYIFPYFVPSSFFSFSFEIVSSFFWSPRWRKVLRGSMLEKRINLRAEVSEKWNIVNAEKRSLTWIFFPSSPFSPPFCPFPFFLSFSYRCFLKTSFFFVQAYSAISIHTLRTDLRCFVTSL